MTNLSYQEKSIWASLLVIIAVGAYFYGKVFSAMAAGTPLPIEGLYRLGLAMVFIIVAAEIALHVAIATHCKGDDPRTDERDVLIHAKAARNAYYVLVAALMLLGGHAALSRLFGRALEVDLSAIIIFGLLAVIVAEVSHYGSQLFYYRRGV